MTFDPDSPLPPGTLGLRLWVGGGASSQLTPGMYQFCFFAVMFLFFCCEILSIDLLLVLLFAVYRFVIFFFSGQFVLLSCTYGSLSVPEMLSFI